MSILTLYVMHINMRFNTFPILDSTEMQWKIQLCLVPCAYLELPHTTIIIRNIRYILYDSDV